MNRRLFLLASFALAGCATTQRSLPAGPTVLGELEPLYAATAGREAITIRVSSNGCTAKPDFAFFVERRADAVTLAFGRKRVDPCRSFAMGHADLTFTWEELGIAARMPVHVLNPLIAWTGPGE